MAGSWPPAGMSPGMQLPQQQPYINWSPQAGNVGSNMPAFLEQLQQMRGQPYSPSSPGGLSAAAVGGAEEAAGAGGLLSRLGSAGFSSPMAGGFKGALGRAGAGMGIAAAGQLGGMVNQAAGGPSELSGALKGAGTGAGLGMMFGAPGAAVGGVVGGAAGALSGPIGELHAVDQYRSVIDKGYLPALKAMPRKYRGDAREAALAIHNNANIPLGQKGAALQTLIQQMGQYAKGSNNVFMGGGQANDKQQNTRDALRVQLELAQMMHQFGQEGVQQGDAMAQSIRSQIPNVAPEMRPMLEMDAAARAAYGRQAQGAYTAAANAQPMVDQMNAQLAQLAQLQQQVNASGGSQTFASLLNPKK